MNLYTSYWAQVKNFPKNLFGLNTNAVRYGLLDDPDMEWVEVDLGGFKDYKLISWKEKNI